MIHHSRALRNESPLFHSELMVRLSVPAAPNRKRSGHRDNATPTSLIAVNDGCTISPGSGDRTCHRNPNWTTNSSRNGTWSMADILEAFLRFFIEVVLEILIKAPGFLIVKTIRVGKETDHDGAAVFIVGVAFWCAVIGGLWAWFA